MALVGWAGMGAAPAAQPPTSIPCTICSTDPVEPVWSEPARATRIKSPAQHMHFTAGAPLRILADALDLNAWMCPPGHPPYVCPGTQVRFYVDGQLAGAVPPNPSDFNLWETASAERAAGGRSRADRDLRALQPVDAERRHADQRPGADHDPRRSGAGRTPTPSTLTEDLVLSGSTALNWTDTTVVGNGFTRDARRPATPATSRSRTRTSAASAAMPPPGST